MMIEPCRSGGTWVFDDPARGLTREPFVSGVPQMIDVLVADVPDAARGFRLLFSSSPFPGFQAEFTRARTDYGGTWYRLDNPPMEGWLCPALFKYFDVAPERLYAKAEPITRPSSSR